MEYDKAAELLKAREEKKQRQALEQAQKLAVSETDACRKRLDELKAHAEKEGYMSDPTIAEMVQQAEVRTLLLWMWVRCGVSLASCKPLLRCVVCFFARDPLPGVVLED